MSLSNRNAPELVRGTSVGGSIKSTSYVSGRGLLTSTASGSSNFESDRAPAAAGASSDTVPSATRRDIEHLKAMVSAAHGAGALYVLGWGSEVRALHVFNRGNGRLTRAARRWARRWASC